MGNKVDEKVLLPEPLKKTTPAQPKKEEPKKEEPKKEEPKKEEPKAATTTPLGDKDEEKKKVDVFVKILDKLVDDGDK